MLNHTSVDHATMREMNLALVLNTLRLYAPISRAALSSTTGLNKATVSLIVKELLAKGFVNEIGIDTSVSEVGRPAINLELNAEAGYIISAEIGVDFISVVATNFMLKVVSRRYEIIPGSTNQQEVLRRTLSLLQDISEELQSHKKRIFGIGVGVPGLVDKNAGSVVFAPNLKWHDVPLRDIVAEKISLPISIANEAKMAALGESYLGKGREYDYILYIHFGVGIGGGIVLNGQVLSGAGGFTGEVGHMMIDPNGPQCNCGNFGCWETLASQQALFRRIQQTISAGQFSVLAKATNDNLTGLTVQNVITAAKQGDAVACKALEETGYWMGVGVANLMNVLNPTCVVFGGPLSLAHEYLLPQMQKIVGERVLPPDNRESPMIVVAAHVADACVMGGAAMIHRDVLSNPVRWL